MQTIKELEKAIGGLSKPSKMPGLAYGTPAINCTVGSLLRNVKGSVCSKCYARKGMYVFGVVKTAQARRLATLKNLPTWTVAMTALLARKYAKKSQADSVFRWHDSGDIQSVEHFEAIVQIAKNLPNIRFWIPTKEIKIIRNWIKANGELPDNLTVRISAAMIDQTINLNIAGLVYSSVGANKGYVCPSYNQDGKCLDCRACWSKEIANVDYKKH